MTRGAETRLESLQKRKAEFIEPMECALVPQLPEGPQWTYESWTAIGPSELEPAATPSCTPATARTSTSDTHTSRKPLLNFHSKPLSMARSWPWTNLEGQIFTVSNTTEQKGRAFTTSFST